MAGSYSDGLAERLDRSAVSYSKEDKEIKQIEGGSLWLRHRLKG